MKLQWKNNCLGVREGTRIFWDDGDLGNTALGIQMNWGVNCNDDVVHGKI